MCQYLTTDQKWAEAEQMKCFNQLTSDSDQPENIYCILTSGLNQSPFIMISSKMFPQKTQSRLAVHQGFFSWKSE